MEPNVNGWDVYININLMDMLDGSTLSFSVLNVKYIACDLEDSADMEEAYAVWKEEVSN